MKRIVAGSACLLIVALGVVGGGASPARAHAAYKESDPANRSTVANPPDRVWAEFTEPVQDQPRFQVFDPCGTRVDHGDVSVSAYRVTVSMSGSAAGTYRVEFHVVSDLDGHATSGAFTFTSSGGAPCEGSGEEGSGASGRSSTERSGSAPEPDSPAAEDPPEETSEMEPSDGSGAGDGKKRGKRSRRPDRPATEQELPAADPVLAQGDPDPAATDDIPLDWLLVGFGLAALIGAIAGQIYASITGPVKRRRR